MKIGGLFSGIGGIEYAFTAAGFDVAWLVEINPFCQHVLRKHWPHARLFSDVHHVGNHNLAPVDVVVGGFPCQPFSIAGSGLGEDDPRHLCPQFHRVITELRPRVVFLENVPNLRNVSDGAAFNRILEQLAQSGYDAEWHCLRAADAGAPHQRERIFIVAYTSSAGLEESRRAGQRQSDEETRAGLVSGIEQSGSIVVNPGGSGWQESDPSRVAGSTGHASGRYASELPRGLSQSGLGADPDGLSRQLVGHRFPAGQGITQFDHEEPRTLAQKEVWHKDKIEAIGNAVVPQVIYPVALAIREWLEAS